MRGLGIEFIKKIRPAISVDSIDISGATARRHLVSVVKIQIRLRAGDKFPSCSPKQLTIDDVY